jgi:hypothetical protein
MPKTADRPLLTALALAVVAELVLLRLGTRTLIHIPGLVRFEDPIHIVAEVGRFAYYVAVVLLFGSLVTVAYRGFQERSLRASGNGAVVVGFLLVAGAGRLEMIPPALVGGYVSLAMVIVLAFGWNGWRSVPLLMFVVAALAAGWSALGQELGVGFTGDQVDALLLVAELTLVLAGVTSPLLLNQPPTRFVLLGGLATTVLLTTALVAANSTMSILLLWTVGVPGWLPAISYGMALGGLAITTWSALSTSQWSVGLGLVMLAAGGVGMISTYQSGLVLAGLLLIVGTPQGPHAPPIPRVEEQSESAALAHV